VWLAYITKLTISKLPQNRNLHVAYKFVSVMVSKVLLKVLGRIFGKLF